MRMKNIGVQLHYIPIHTHPFYKKLGFKYGDFPQSEIYAKKAMSLPLFPGLKKRNQIQVINYLQDLIKWIYALFQLEEEVKEFQKKILGYFAANQ